MEFGSEEWAEHWRISRRNDELEADNRRRSRYPEMFRSSAEDEPDAKFYLCCGAYWEDGCRCDSEGSDSTLTHNAED
jgi:hypothetical protein